MIKVDCISDTSAIQKRLLVSRDKRRLNLVPEHKHSSHHTIVVSAFSYVGSFHLTNVPVLVELTFDFASKIYSFRIFLMTVSTSGPSNMQE